MATTELVKLEPTTVVDLEAATEFHVDGPESCELAVELREGVKALIAEIEAGYRPFVAQAHALHKSLLNELKGRLAAPGEALAALNRAIGNYERTRLQREALALRQAEVDAQAAAEAARAADAAAQRAKGNEALARDIEASPVEEFLAPVVVPREVKTAGVAVTVSYEPEVIDLRALVEFAISTNATMLALLVEPNLKGLQSLVTQLGEGFNIPGVRRVAKAPVVRSTRGGR